MAADSNDHSPALRLAKVFDVSADFWMNIQHTWYHDFAKEVESDAHQKAKSSSEYDP